MGLRRDALSGAAKAVVEIESLAVDAAEEGDLVATVGEFTTYEGAINKVCGKASFPIDIRSNDESFRDSFEETVLERIRTIVDERELSVDIEQVDRSEPVDLDDGISSILEDIASDSDITHRRMPSGGGHDAMNLQHAGIPTGMLFVPSIDGISHNPDEATPKETIEDAAEVMSRALLHGPSTESEE